MKTQFSALSLRARLALVLASLFGILCYGSIQSPSFGDTQNEPQAAPAPVPDEDDLIADDYCKWRWFEYYYCVTHSQPNCEEPDCDMLDRTEVIISVLQTLAAES